MKIRGNYEQDKNFITMFSNNAVYTISRDTGKWGGVSASVRGRLVARFLTKSLMMSGKLLVKRLEKK